MTLENKTVFITGVTKGIGRAIAEEFYKSGARVIGTGTKDCDTWKSVCHDYYCSDFSDRQQIFECAKYVKKNAPDILINNAGINKIAPFTKIVSSDFLAIQQVNLYAPFLLCQAAIPSMLSKQWGRIVNISSIFGKISKENRAAYSASKFALDGLTLSLAVEHACNGIIANCISPGFTDTELTHKVLGKQGIEEIESMIPIGRMAKVEEIAKSVLWLCSPSNTYITGQNIAVDGGFSRV